jgi:hypothetical protein
VRQYLSRYGFREGLRHGVPNYGLVASSLAVLAQRRMTVFATRSFIGRVATMGWKKTSTTLLMRCSLRFLERHVLVASKRLDALLLIEVGANSQHGWQPGNSGG